MPLPPGGAPGGTGVLDAPPPSPSVPGGGAGGQQMPTFGGLAPPAQLGAAQMPPEILTGIMQAAEKISSMFDAFAQATPDLAADWDILKDLLQRTMGKVLVAGGGPTSPNATGGGFPGGPMTQARP